MLIETSYNAYTEFDVSFDDCVFYTTKTKDYQVNAGSLTVEVNTRPELSEKRLPRVSVNRMRVISLETNKEIRQVKVFREKGVFIQERMIQNVIKLK